MTRSMKALMTCAAMLGASSGAVAGPTEGAHPELGAIEWMRDFDAAQAAARQSGRPMLVLFDEVPGCHTCVSFGETTLSHPLIVEAAETLFTPVAVFNNIEGRDREVLNSFNEPTWNNPVIRVMDAQRRELAPRHADDYSVAGLAATMAAALQSHGQTPPQWLTMLAHEDVKTERATFAMHCFWEGEALLGGIEGVTKTRTGWLDNREVVELWFDPAQVSYATLVEKAQSMSCADRIYARTDAQARTAKQHAPDRTVRTDDSIRATPDDDKYAMRQTTWARVPMTEAQAVRVNASISEGVNPGDVLSPRQRALHGVISTHPDAPWPMCIGREEITAAWRSTMAAADAAGLR